MNLTQSNLSGSDPNPSSSPTTYIDQKVETKRLGCNAGHQEVSRCCTRVESEESVAYRWQNMQARNSLWL